MDRLRERVGQRKRRRNGGETHIQVMEGNIQREGNKGGKATDWRERIEESEEEERSELIPGEFIQGQKEKQQKRDLQEVSKHIRRKEG